ncbi:MAG: hypothetical protein KAJ95_03750 [Gammaproteobacteria bacterium]|nr:hypothetical protein [Gammaproteobacteria bacterium]
MESQKLLQESGKRIVISPTSSRFILLFISALHLLALALLFFIDLNVYLLLILAAMIMLNLYQALLYINSIHHCLSLLPGELMYCRIKGGSWQQVDVIESFVTNRLIVLRLKTLRHSKLQSFVYAFDSLNEYSFRQLRLHLNHYCAES